MNPTVETSVIAFPKLYQRQEKGEISLSDVEHAVKLSAAELRARWLKDSIPPWDTSERTRIIHTAYISDMSDAAFRVLFGQQYFGAADGDGAFPSNQTIAALCNKSVPSVKRANKELEDSGWIRSKRRRNRPSIRTTQIPEAVLARISGELSEIMSDPRRLKNEPSQIPESSNTSLLEPESSKMSLLPPPEGSKMSLLNSRRLKNEPLPLREEEDFSASARTHDKPEVVSTGSCTIDENLFEIFNRVYSEWGLRPGALEIQPWSKSPRSVTDKNLLGYVNAHNDKPERIVSQALFEALTYMADKRTDELQREGGGGRGKAGFGAYFAKMLRSKVTELMLAEKEASAQAALIDEKARLALAAETAIAAMRPQAFADRIEIGHKAAEARVSSPPSMNGNNAHKAETRFDDCSPKVAVVKQSWISGEQANEVIKRVPGVNASRVKEVLAEADGRPDDLFYTKGAFGGGMSRKISVSRIIDWCVAQLMASQMDNGLGVTGKC